MLAPRAEVTTEKLMVFILRPNDYKAFSVLTLLRRPSLRFFKKMSLLGQIIDSHRQFMIMT